MGCGGMGNEGGGGEPGEENQLDSHHHLPALWSSCVLKKHSYFCTECDGGSLS